MLESEFSAAFGYLKDTFLNSTVPFSAHSVTLPETIDEDLSSTSLIRSADTCACGSSINIITSIINDITTYVA